MPTTDDLLNTAYREYFEAQQAQAAYDLWLEEQELFREAQRAIEWLYRAAQGETLSSEDCTDDGYDDDF